MDILRQENNNNTTGCPLQKFTRELTYYLEQNKCNNLQNIIIVNYIHATAG